MDFKEVIEESGKVILKDVKNFELPHILIADNVLDGTDKIIIII